METLVAWLRRQSDLELERMGTTRQLIGDREFYPRILIGEYLHDQFWQLVRKGIANGHSIDVRGLSRVTDIELQERSILLKVAHDGADPTALSFDHVVLATGHNWPETIEPAPGYFVSPWPASDLERIEDCSVGMPEADFYCAYPNEPLKICTEAAIDHLIATGPSGLLDAAFELFKAELSSADPDYASRIGLATSSVETIADRYFAAREASDQFVWAAHNLAQAEDNTRAKRTVAWRYAILRMHEVVARVVPHLDETDLKRFHQHFKVVFVDDYATVPHQSIKRLLALHNAGRLNVKSLGNDYDIRKNNPRPGVTVVVDGAETSYDAFIDATGQHPLSTRDLPFASLHGVVKAALTAASGALDEIAGQGVRTGGRS